MPNMIFERYKRQTILPEIGIKGQKKILDAKVLIVGIGGLGSITAQYLTGAGIGTIGLIDDDLVLETNLNRQLLYTEKDINKCKVQVASDRLKAINKNLNFIVYNDRINNFNVKKIVAEYDIIVDGLDNSCTRYLIDTECQKQKKPYIYGGVNEYTGQISVFNYKNGPSYADVFPDYENQDKIFNGLFGVLPGLIGILQANEVIKIITGVGEVLSGKLLQYNLKTNTQEIFDI